jgi:2-octaprenyl-6-methoxyphenol hydroxylase
MDQSRAEVAIVGGGPAGLTAAVAMASAGVQTALIARPAPPDNRTTALLASSVAALATLNLWDRCREQAAPLRVMRLIDDTQRLLRAPEVLFEASEIGLEAFGYNIENRHLMTALEARVAELSSLQRITGEAEAFDFGPEDVTVRLRSGATVCAKLLVAADGRSSLCRSAAGIETDTRTYPQSAFTCNLTHARPHGDISTEFHTESGPFTLVPLPGNRSSLVCVVEPSVAALLRALDDADLCLEVERRSHSILGKIEVEAGRGLFPLAAAVARQMAGDRIVLIGEAGHVIPPIGAQGLNLGMRDAATVSELVVAARRCGDDVGGAELTRRYMEMRRPDVTSRTWAVDLLNRSLLSDLLPLQGARGVGLYLLDQIGPLRRALMREGVTPASQPRLMRGEAL